MAANRRALAHRQNRNRTHSRPLNPAQPRHRPSAVTIHLHRRTTTTRLQSSTILKWLLGSLNG